MLKFNHLIYLSISAYVDGAMHLVFQVRQLNVACNPDFSFSNFLAKPTTVREWNIQVCVINKLGGL